ncbi:MAG: type II toxin-antitoxin system HicA family toxin [Sumerlaeia bacterium]
MPTTVREAIRLVEKDGWCSVSQKGSHRHFKHPIKPGKVTIPGNLNEELKPGTWASIKRQAGLTEVGK